MSLFLCMVWGCVLVSLIYTLLSSFPSTACWRDCLLPVVYSYHLCRIPVDCRCLGFFLGSLFRSIGQDVCVCTSPTLSGLLLLCHSVGHQDNRRSYASCLVCAPQDCLAIQGLLWFPIHFWMVCSRSEQHVISNVAGISSSVSIALSGWHFNGINPSSPRASGPLPISPNLL